MPYWRKIATLMNPELLERLATTLDDRDPDAAAQARQRADDLRNNVIPLDSKGNRS